MNKSISRSNCRVAKPHDTKSSWIMKCGQRESVQALTFLQKNQKGHAIFFPLDRINGNTTVPEEILQKPDVVGIASKLVNGTEAVCKVIGGFLNNTVVIKNLSAALSLNGHTHTVRW